MKGFIIVLILLLSASTINSDILEVDITGNHDFTEIQAGISAAVNGDTILVYQGEYYENVDMSGKTIVLGSLYLLTGDREYIRTTIINGNQTSSCVVVNSGEAEGTTLCGFTFTNGSGFTLSSYVSAGGGVIVNESCVLIDNCLLEKNQADYGGGLVIFSNSNVSLKGCTIRKNKAFGLAGGIYLTNGNTEILFDEDDRCNIYNNYASMGSDICSYYDGGNISVIVDTLTSFDYWGYSVMQYDNTPPWVLDDGFEFEMENSWLEPVEADLYVAPWGNDDNNGLTEAEPLQKIAWAMQKIAFNESDPHTIHLADGVYSPVATGELFPFQMKGWVTLSGESSENTILDAEWESNIILTEFLGGDIKLENLKFTHGASPNASGYDDYVIKFHRNWDAELHFENLIIEDNQPDGVLIMLETFSEVYMDNIIFRGNTGNGFNWNEIRLTPCNSDESTRIYLNNITIHDNNRCILGLQGRSSVPKFYISNLLMYNNTYDYYNTINNNYSAIGCVEWQDTYLINCTIGENDLNLQPPTGIILVADFVNLEIINSVICSSGTDYLVLDAGYPSEINISNSLLDYSEAELISYGLSSINYNSETIFNEDPLFSYEEEHLYSVLEGSPCIDAGTTEMPEGFTLPETDIMGNPRIMGNGIDIGAYEYNPYGSNTDDEIIEVNDQLIVYPNPLMAGNQRNDQAKILWQGETSEDLSFEIFNIKGQRLRELKIENVKCKIGDGSRNVVWDGKDDTGNPVSSGVYFVRVKTGDDYIAQSKLTVVK